MNLNDVMGSEPGRRRRKRVGRGIGSGRGKTCTRGTKGAGARSGSGGKMFFEGGQMPLYRRLPHRGFNNERFRDPAYAGVNLEQLERTFKAGEIVDLSSLQARGVVKKSAKRVKILGSGDLSKKLSIRVDAVSASALKKIEAASGTFEPVKK